MNIKQKITCPTCGKQTTWNPQNTYRPFCSDRCKLIDLGEWANESRKIAGEPVDPTSLIADNDGDRDNHF